MKKTKLLDLTIIVLLILYFLGLLAFDYKSFGLENPPITLNPSFYEPFKHLIWVIFALLVLDIYLKHKKIGDTKQFVEKHWWDIFLLLLIPLLSVFKILKIAPKFIKKINALKTSYKIARKSKKISTK